MKAWLVRESRERLVEMIQDAVGGCARHWAEIIADRLLANGVVVLDMNVITTKNRPLITHIAGNPINDVLDLIRAKEEGRLIVPPCKVGDIVWNVCADDIVRPWKVKFRTYDDREGWWIFLDWEGEDRHAKCSGDYFREKYFLAKEEAEARLRETTLMKKLPTNSHEYPHRHRPTPTKH